MAFALTVLRIIYVAAALLLGVYGLQALVLSILYLLHRDEGLDPPAVESWPSVTVQLPIYNELYVAESLLHAVARLKYPRDKLQIHVLDDSTDETYALLERLVARYRRAGLDIEHLHRTDRRGYKAGALAEALPRARGDLIAIFDADFIPPADFLLRVVPYFGLDPQVGFVQARWSHTNAELSSLTRAQAIGLDGHFVVEQISRHRSGLFMSFNGTAGVWRRTSIEQSGGWQADTLCEDLDLSYRAQLAGWKPVYLPEVSAPCEIPPQMAALKRQQARWAQGSVQCLIKLAGPVVKSGKPWPVRFLGLTHLGAYLAHPMSLIMLLCVLPLLLWDGGIHLPLAFLNLVSLGPPLVYLLGQQRLYRDWPRRLVSSPFLLLLGAGLAWSNTAAVLRALLRRPTPFLRTPKFRLRGRSAPWQGKRYVLGWEWADLGEFAMLAYAGLAMMVAMHRGFWYMIPFLALYAGGFAYVALYDLWSAWNARAARSRQAGSEHSPVTPAP